MHLKKADVFKIATGFIFQKYWLKLLLIAMIGYVFSMCAVWILLMYF